MDLPRYGEMNRDAAYLEVVRINFPAERGRLLEAQAFAGLGLHAQQFLTVNDVRHEPPVCIRAYGNERFKFSFVAGNPNDLARNRIEKVDRGVVSAQQSIARFGHTPQLKVLANEPSPIGEDGIAGNIGLCKVSSKSILLPYTLSERGYSGCGVGARGGALRSRPGQALRSPRWSPELHCLPCYRGLREFCDWYSLVLVAYSPDCSRSAIS